MLVLFLRYTFGCRNYWWLDWKSIEESKSWDEFRNNLHFAISNKEDMREFLRMSIGAFHIRVGVEVGWYSFVGTDWRNLWVSWVATLTDEWRITKNTSLGNDFADHYPMGVFATFLSPAPPRSCPCCISMSLGMSINWSSVWWVYDIRPELIFRWGNEMTVFVLMYL